MSATPHAPSPRRDAGIDSLRGLMLLAMGTNHIASLLQKVTDHPFGYTSSAEGFVFLSGLVAGLVYTRRGERLGPEATARASYERARTIYFYHLALLIGVLVWVNAFLAMTGEVAGNAPELMLDHPLRAMLAGAFLVYQPPLLDILPMYAGFMLMLPTVLRALDAGHQRLVLCVSFGVWALTNVVLPQTAYLHGVIQIGAFNWTAWQLLFFLGVFFGHGAANSRQPFVGQRGWLVPLALAICIGGFLVRHFYVPAPFADFATWVNKNNLAPARLLNTLALFLLVHFAFMRWRRAFNWPPLAFLGRHSLAVYSAHVGIAYLLYAFPQYVADTPTKTWIGTAIMFAGLFSVAAAREHFVRRKSLRIAMRPVNT